MSYNILAGAFALKVSELVRMFLRLLMGQGGHCCGFICSQPARMFPKAKWNRQADRQTNRQDPILSQVDTFGNLPKII